MKNQNLGVKLLLY